MSIARTITDFIGPGGWLTITAINACLALQAHNARNKASRRLDTAMESANNLDYLIEGRTIEDLELIIDALEYLEQNRNLSANETLRCRRTMSRAQQAITRIRNREAQTP